MGLTPVPQRVRQSDSTEAATSRTETVDWIALAAGGSLIAAGLLLLSGKRRAAMAAAAAGTSLAMLEQQDLLRSLWKQLPGYVDQVQQAISQVRNTVEDITAQTSPPPKPAPSPTEG